MSDRVSQVRSATCQGCGRAFTILLEGGLSAEAAGSAAEAVPAPHVPVIGEVACDECGEALAFELGAGPSIVGRCADCETEIIFRPETEE
ncbi:MAG: hypothetical protein ACREC5_08095 [Thermoplasmata archaeon]